MYFKWIRTAMDDKKTPDNIGLAYRLVAVG